MESSANVGLVRVLEFRLGGARGNRPEGLKGLHDNVLEIVDQVLVKVVQHLHMHACI